MVVSIDEHSGFCFGVTGAIRQAEEQLQSGSLYCLGDIVHNSEEVHRLEALGLETIDYDDLRTMHGVRVLFRAHGEPPSTYRIAEQNGIRVTDATCPVVLALQRRIRRTYEQIRQAGDDAQIVIYGQMGHAEVVGLRGQTNDTAIVVEKDEDLAAIDFERDIYIFSQTTKSVSGFQHMVEAIRARAHGRVEYHDTICRNVANRVEELRRYAAAQDVVIFVGGRKSSNAKVLYQHCVEANANSLFISGVEDLTSEQLSQWSALPDLKIGICGATSTPLWLMQKVKEKIETFK